MGGTRERFETRDGTRTLQGFLVKTSRSPLFSLCRLHRSLKHRACTIVYLSPTIVLLLVMYVLVIGVSTGQGNKLMISVQPLFGYEGCIG